MLRGTLSFNVAARSGPLAGIRRHALAVSLATAFAFLPAGPGPGLADDLGTCRIETADPARGCLCVTDGTLSDESSADFIAVEDLLNAGWFDRAEAAQLLALTSLRQEGPDGRTCRAVIQNYLGSIAHSRRDYDEAEHAFLSGMQAIEGSELPRDRTIAMNILQNAAISYGKTGRYIEADAMYALIDRAIQDHFPDDRQRFIYVEANKSVLHSQMGKADRRLQVHESLLSEALTVLSGASRAQFLQNYAALLAEAGRGDAATGIFSDVVNYIERDLGAKHPLYGRALQQLASHLSSVGDQEGAAANFARMTEAYSDLLASHPFVTEGNWYRGAFLAARGNR